MYIGLAVGVGFVVGTCAGYFGYIRPLKEENLKFRKAIERGTVAILDAVKSASNIDPAKDVEINRLQKELVKESREYTDNVTVLTKELDKLRSKNEQLVAASTELQNTIEHMQFDLDEAVQNAEAAKRELVKAEIANADKVKIKFVKPKDDYDDIWLGLYESTADTLAALGDPKSNYETGIYNGVVSITNALLDKDAFMMLNPVSDPIRVMPKRDAKGRFLKSI